MKRGGIALAALTLLLLFALGCSAAREDEAVLPEATSLPTAAPTAVAAPTATPLPDDYDAPVDFSGQPGLLRAVQYALATDRNEITYRELDTIETLILADGAHITDVGVLARATNLSKLVVVDGELDLSPLAGLPRLTSLTVTGGWYGDLCRVAVLPQLTELNLFGYDTTDFTPLYELKQLTTFRAGNHQTYDFSALADMPRLTTLLLPDARKNDLSWIAGLTNLEDLTIWPCKQKYFDWMSGMTSLRRLHLDMRVNADFSALAALTNLTELRIEMESGRVLDDLSWLGVLTELDTLYLNGLRLPNMHVLEGLKNLETLTLGNVHDSIRIYEFPDLPDLTSLTITDCSVVNAGDLVRFPALTRLALVNSTVDDHRAIYELTKLTSLTMRPDAAGGVRSIGGVERLTALTNLTELDWGGRAGKLDEIAALSKLEKLRLSGARVTDWRALTRLSNLRELDLSHNRIARVPDTISNMTALERLDLSDNGLRYVELLKQVPSLTHLTVAGLGRTTDLATLTTLPRLAALRLVPLAKTDMTVERIDALGAETDAITDALRLTAPYLNDAESEAVMARFQLFDYLHQPYYGSEAWYPPLAAPY